VLQAEAATNNASKGGGAGVGPSVEGATLLAYSLLHGNGAFRVRECYMG